MVKPIVCDNVVTFSNGVAYQLPWASEDYCYEFCSLIFLVLGELQNNARNVWCFDQEGNKLWEIEPSLWDSPYFEMNLDDQGKVRVYDQRGDTYILDVETGYVEWVGGDWGRGDVQGANNFIRKRREERRKTQS